MVFRLTSLNDKGSILKSTKRKPVKKNLLQKKKTERTEKSSKISKKEKNVKFTQKFRYLGSFIRLNRNHQNKHKSKKSQRTSKKKKNYKIRNNLQKFRQLC